MQCTQQVVTKGKHSKYSGSWTRQLYCTHKVTRPYVTPVQISVSNLHIIVAHTIHQQAFQVERRCKASKFQQTFNFNCLVDLRHLSDQTHKCHILKCRHILLKWRALISKQFLHNDVHTRAQLQWVKIHLKPCIQLLQARWRQRHHIHTHLQYRNTNVIDQWQPWALLD